MHGLHVGEIVYIYIYPIYIHTYFCIYLYIAIGNITSIMDIDHYFIIYKLLEVF